MSDKLKKLGTFMHKAGCKFYKYNKETKSIVEAEIVEINGRKSIINDPSCIFIQSLNLKNAVRKLRNAGYEVIN